jgi:tetratricopeptide (TPR) repeat protein
MRKAQDHFRNAIDLDPSYARAYSGLADTYAMLGGFHVTPMKESHPLAREAALKALGLDDSLGEAHRSLATIIEDHYWDWGDAERHYQRAIELDPNDVTALRFYSFYLASMGRSVEALPIAEKARHLDPVSPIARMNLGAILYLAGHVDAAVRQFEETLDLDSNFGFAHSMLGLAYLRKGTPDRAVGHAQKARALSGTRPDVIALGGYTVARAGRWREALATLEDLRRLASPRDPSPFLVALVYVGLEDMDRAFEWLEKAVEARSWELPLLKVDPIFETLRADRRFPALLNRLGLPLTANSTRLARTTAF